jgi:hypothetical protein
MDDKVYFQTKITCDLDYDRECSRIHHLTSRFELIRRLGICAILYMIYSSNYKYSALITVAYIIGAVGAHITVFFRLRNGSNWYKEMMENNGGEPICNIVSLLDTKAVTVNPKTGKCKEAAYAQCTHYSQSLHYVFLFGSVPNFLIDITKLEGGTVEELLAFLHSRCPNLKKKLINETLGMVLAAAYICTLAVFLALAIFA